MNRKMTTGAPQLHPISMQAPWHVIGIDFVGPLSPIAEDGSHYILTISDYFTKWVEAVPTPDKSASQVASVLFKVSYILFCDVKIVFNNNNNYYNYYNSDFHANGSSTSHSV